MLLTLPQIKTRLNLKDSDVLDDALLTQFIQMASGRIENDANRSFGYVLNQVDEFQADETELRLSHYPIDENQPITFTLLVKRSEGWQPTIPEFIVRSNCVLSLISRIGNWKSQIRCTYSGGHVLPDMDPAQFPGVPALPLDLVGAAIEQVAYWYQNKDRLGISSQSGQGGSFSMKTIDLLPSVTSVIAKYERWMP